MAISRSTLNKSKEMEPALVAGEAEPVAAPEEALQREEAGMESRDAKADSNVSSFRILRTSMSRLGKKGAQASSEAAPEPETPTVEVEPELVYPPMLRPSDVQKMGYVSPVYTLSRSVQLNPRLLSSNRVVTLSESPEVESYRQLRTRILQQTGGEGATVMVTSAIPGEGKTLTAINLALTFARDFKQTALLVDCDLRQQQVHQTLGFASDRGLVDYLLDDCPIPELFVWPGVEKLTLISGGKKVKESCELLGSPGMRDLVADMRSRYPERYVFFDTPPVLTSADALAFAPLVDYIVVVVQAGRTSLNDLNRALGMLPGEKVLGLVLNRH